MLGGTSGTTLERIWLQTPKNHKKTTFRDALLGYIFNRIAASFSIDVPFEVIPSAMYLCGLPLAIYLISLLVLRAHLCGGACMGCRRHPQQQSRSEEGGESESTRQLSKHVDPGRGDSTDWNSNPMTTDTTTLSAINNGGHTSVRFGEKHRQSDAEPTRADSTNWNANPMANHPVAIARRASGQQRGSVQFDQTSDAESETSEGGNCARNSKLCATSSVGGNTARTSTAGSLGALEEERQDSTQWQNSPMRLHVSKAQGTPKNDEGSTNTYRRTSIRRPIQLMFGLQTLPNHETRHFCKSWWQFMIRNHDTYVSSVLDSRRERERERGYLLCRESAAVAVGHPKCNEHKSTDVCVVLPPPPTLLLPRPSTSFPSASSMRVPSFPPSLAPFFAPKEPGRGRVYFMSMLFVKYALCVASGTILYHLHSCFKWSDAVLGASSTASSSWATFGWWQGKAALVRKWVVVERWCVCGVCSVCSVVLCSLHHVLIQFLSFVHSSLSTFSYSPSSVSSSALLRPLPSSRLYSHWHCKRFPLFCFL